MPPVVDVKSTLGAILIGCFIAIAYELVLICFAPFLIQAPAMQALRSCALSGLHLLSALPK